MDRQADTAEQILARQRAAFQEDIYPPYEVRMERLSRIGKLLDEQSDTLCEAIAEDFGNRSHYETKLLEIAPLKSELRHAKSHLRKWMRPSRRGRSIEFLQMSNWVQYQPLGVVGIMVPWNYPLILALGPLIDVLAAGNRAMIKPSELLPATSALLARLIAQYFPPEEATVIEGGVDIAEMFSALPFDHLIFTGSTAVGKKVMAAAAANLTPLTLELGGKSPTIVAPDYPVEKAARDIAFGKLMNAGQTCIAPDYVLVERKKMDALKQALLKQVDALYPQNTASQQYTSLVGERSFERLKQGLAELQTRNTEVIAAAISTTETGFNMVPTLVIDPPPDCRLMEEEIFGPILPLVPYDTLQEAIAFVQARPRPLALYIFTNDRSAEDEVLKGTISGNVTINGTLLHIAQSELPFGGVGPSGIGAYHGYDGFKRFSHARGIAKVRFFNPAVLAMPPYGKIANLLGRFMSR
ncbi:coniferyl aldehyde dehydrogenase [Rhizobium sp. L1K21]|uniref:coniferyl aldehyde dehydrogenase n=1 Tax=Rhizobium sp. L1K21 TaxID=2954933 RepID=UPI002092F543|nr:coniferyl aldehyde dehydrogenase [Rhizobium sp. L1K21]MCO6188576.1 coniferyl aldehyde dehydrogenase [Rhizobium sp. L1K21]